MDGPGGFVDVRLPPHPASVAEARALLRTLLADAGREDLVETAVLLVSEVVTNALLHAGTDIHLTGRLDRGGLHVSVGDGSTHLPARRRYAATAGTGRGLLMVESMVDEWGVTRRDDGKTVWFRVSDNDQDTHEPSRGRLRGTARDGADGSVLVQLLDMPLLLHAAWQEHAEALLREYLLAVLQHEDADDDPVRVHAEATDAIAVLEEHVPHGVRLAPDEVRADAVEPAVSAQRVDVPVPAASVEHFRTLDRAIDAALELSAAGLVLTPPTQPEVQAFRRWLCGQVLAQAGGAAPEPWVVPSGDTADVVLPEGWDPAEVRDAATARVAADQSSRILAVSRSAASMLGYDDPAELVGQRIVAIVPERYRQAHLAGFTAYLLVGRKPLLDGPVVIPALRRDGSEVTVELTVREADLRHGHALLLADLRVPEPPAAERDPALGGPG